MGVRLLVLVLAALLGSPIARAPVFAQSQPGSHALSGTWNVSATGPTFRTGTYSFQQQNHSVIGANPAGGQMHGKLKDPRTVEGTWIGPTGTTGWFSLHLAPDGKSFRGQYGSGGKPIGTIVGHRKPASE
ncbi:MAG TPA: hypothetical protein VMA36_14015 [Candidatus Limnocylindria bacterium]|jgi:hypothetical protein|nr:hypothetical protein [Candidatus Limnocylindria bacterium]